MKYKVKVKNDIITYNYIEIYARIKIYNYIILIKYIACNALFFIIKLFEINFIRNKLLIEEVDDNNKSLSFAKDRLFVNTIFNY